MILGSSIPWRPGHRDRDYASMFPRLDGIVDVHYLPNACPWSISYVHLRLGGVEF
ncbi:MAG: hypothetical protein WB715_07320 [Roseiarcus sp.]|uniref:hypothetical protein n=1 Tax=Roseiarcus sp. TaxID=1969460 RepID=UPI003C63DF57